MNKVILYIASSLDGYIAGQDDDISWLDKYNDVANGYGEFFSTIGAVIVGRRTFEIERKLGGGKTHRVPIFVLSHNPPGQKPDRSDIVFTDGDIEEVLEKAKRLTKKNIWIMGGGIVAQQFLERGLIDEIRLTVVPIILGRGIRLFDRQSKEIALSVTEVKQYEKGLIELSYEITKAS